MDQAKSDYIKHTILLNDYNEIYNLNDYFNSSMAVQDQQLTELNDTLQSKMLQLKQQVFDYESSAKRTHMRTSIMQATIVYVAVSFILVAFYCENKLSSGLLIFLMIGVFLLYMIVFLMIFYQNRDRRRLDWNQFYFDSVPKK